MLPSIIFFEQNILTLRKKQTKDIQVMMLIKACSDGTIVTAISLSQPLYCVKFSGSVYVVNCENGTKPHVAHKSP